MVDYYRSGGEAPRIAAGIKILENLPAGELYGPKALREEIMLGCDLAARTVQNLIYDAMHCKEPILRKFGNGRQTRYARLQD